MKYYCWIFLFLSIIITVDAQIDRQNTSIAIPAEQTENPKAENSIKINPLLNENTEEQPEKPAVKAPLLETKPSEKPFSILDDERFADIGDLYTDRIKRQLPQKSSAEQQVYGSVVDQFFGNFNTKSKSVNIVYRDFQYPDGDLIQIRINDDIIVPRVLLNNGFKGLKITLRPGINKIDFVALNQGESGPNTAEFKVLDENGIPLAGNQWNLATGVKATIIIVKE